MNRLVYTVAAVLIFGALSAQINRGGNPVTFKMKNLTSEVPFYKVASVDLSLAAAQDEVTDQYKETPYRFGIEHDVDLDFFAMASSEALKGNRKVWRLGIDCPNATSISMRFDNFFLPEGSEMYIYSEDRVSVKGAFNFESNKESGVFPVGLIQSDRVIIEYTEPISGDQASLIIGQVVHGYRDVVNKLEEKGPWGNSGPCNINVNCPEGLPYQDIKRSVAIIIQGGFAQCSGSMVNNTLQDETPYFLTANHCLGNPNNWVYYFNHETTGCTGSTGPQDQSVSGGDLKASNGASDFALVELSENVPSSYNVYFAGWDNSDATTVTSAVGIHHPSGDLKKICFEDDAPYHNSAAGAAVWYIDQWELGVTEGGSSGSPLFDQNGRVIGQLYGGAAACSGNVNNGQFDYYGRFGVSWPGATTSSLHTWLDPSSSGVSTIDGYGPNDVIYANDAAGQGITDIPDLLCDLSAFSPSFILRNVGTNTLTSATINYTYNGSNQSPINWTGSLSQNQTAAVALASFNPTSGTNSISVTVSNPNGGTDENDANNVSVASFQGAAATDSEWNVVILTDDYGYETYWEIHEVGGSVVASGGNQAVGINGGGDQTASATDPDVYLDFTTYSEIVNLSSNGCYEFVIVDDWGDGICCGETGNGSFSVTDGSGSVILTGGQFDDLVSVERSVIATSLDESFLSSRLVLYPNPTENELNVMVEDIEGVFSFSILNTLGQVVKNGQVIGGTATLLDLQGLASGQYVLQLRNETYAGSKRFSKQ